MRPSASHATETRAAGLERTRRTALCDQVDQQLLELVGIGAHCDIRTGSGDARQGASRRRTIRRTSASTLTDGELRLRQLRQARVAVVKRLSESERAAITARPRACLRSQLVAAICVHARSIDSRLPAIDLIGASELLISWPMTRISRCHA